MISNMMRNLNRTMLRLDKKQMQGYTGKRIHKASDDPIATSRVLKVKADISQLRQYDKNVDDAISWLETTELAVKNTNEALHRIRELTVQAANGVLTEEETQKVNEEIKQLKAQIISLGNTTYGSSYIFTGKKVDQPLLDEFGNYTVNLKDYVNPHIVDDKKDVQVGTRENIGVNTLGFEIFEGYEKPVIYSEDLGEPPLANDTEIELQLQDGKTAKVILKLGGTEGVDINQEGTEGTVTLAAGASEEEKIDAILNTFKEMAEVYDSPLKGYTFEEFSAKELDGSDIKDVMRIKATPTDAMAVDSRTMPAVWETGEIDITSLDLSNGKTATFTFMGVTMNIVEGTSAEIKDVNGRGATIVVDASLTAGDLADNLQAAFEEVSKEVGSKIEGFSFELDGTGTGLRIIAPESAGGRYNNETFDGTVEIGNSTTQQLVVEGVGERKSVTKGQKAGIIQLIEKLEKEMTEGNHEELNNLLGVIDKFQQSLLTTKSEVGAKVNRMDLVKERVAGDIINFRDLQSQLEDADMAEVIMELMNEENVYRSSLAMGARIIQPSLLDFLR